MKAKQGLIALAVILGILLLVSAWWGWQQSNKKKNMIQENELLSAELGDLNDLKEELQLEVDSLVKEYDLLAEENETLHGSLAEAESRASRKDRALRNAKKQSATEVNNLRAEIQDLLAIKSELEFSIDALQMENDSLRTRTGILEQDLSLAKGENAALANLNQTIQEELKMLTLANFKATAFQVEVEQKKAKVTSKSRRVRRIRVSFDLTGVPEKYQGVRPLYLVITDDKATPIKTENPIQATVVVNGQPMDLIAVSSKDVNIAQSQRLSFKHDIAEKLSSGYYRVSVFTDIGLLGASSFRLR